MKNRHLILLIILFSLPQVLKAQVSLNYEFEIDKELWKKEKINVNKRLDKKFLNDGNLYLHFQSDFKNDSVLIKKNNKSFGQFELTTDWSTALAQVIVIPDFKDIRNISLSFNGGKEIKFEIDELNQIIIRNKENKIFIGYSKHVHYYD